MKITKLKIAILSLLLFYQAPILANDDHNKKIMEKIMVVGSVDNIKNIAGSAHYIDQDQLEKFSYKDINRVLKQVPGVNIQEEDGFGLRPNIGLRGGRSNRSNDIVLMEDSILIAPAPYSAPDAYYFPRISKMSGVEVRKGSSSIEFGPKTTNGAINLITKNTPNKKTYNIYAGYGSFNSNVINVNYGDKVDNLSFLIDLSHEKSDGFKKIDAVNKNTGYDIQDVMAKFKYETDQNADIYQSIELKLGYSQEVSNETYLGLEDSDFYQDPYRRYAASQLDKMENDHQKYHLRHYIDFNNFDLTTTIYRNDFARNWYKLKTKDVTSALNQDDLKLRANNRKYYSQGVQSLLTSQFNHKNFSHNIKFSTRYHNDQESRFQRDDSYNLENGIMNLANYGINGKAGDSDKKSDAISIFISDSIKYKKLTITPGLRYENINLKLIDRNSSAKNNNHNISALIPGISAIYQLHQDYNIFSSIHKGFTPPSPSSKKQESEKSINYEAGIRFDNNIVKSSLIGFFNDYSNLLGECSQSVGGNDCNIGDQYNSGEVTIKGLEFELSYNILNHFNLDNLQLPLTFNYTYNDARFQSSFNSDFKPWGNVNKGDQLPYIAKNQFFISLGLIHDKYQINLNAKYLSKMRSKAGSGIIDQNELINDHIIIDLASELEIYQNTRLFFNIDNLFNKKYMASRTPDRARPGKPLAFMTGIKYKF